MTKPRFPSIVGDWTSRFRLSEEPGQPEVTEIVEIKAARGGVSIATKETPENYYYTAHGRIYDNDIAGEWHVRLGSGDGKGLFLLTMNPRGNVMYGYNTAFDENHGIVFTSWILAKNDTEEKKVNERLLWGERQLKENTLAPSNS
jgi:hypothetical protein